MPQTGSVDIDLMQKKRLSSLEEQNRAANELRDARRSSVAGSVNEEKGMTLRQQVIAARKQLAGAAKNARKTSSGMGAVKGPNKAKMGTAQLLKAAWINVIDSFGATLLYINFHAFARLIPGLRNVFCRLGEEWLPKGTSASMPGLEDKIAKVGLLEKMLLAVVDAILLAALLVVVALFIIIVNMFFASWKERVETIFENWELFKELVKLLG